MMDYEPYISQLHIELDEYIPQSPEFGWRWIYSGNDGNPLRNKDKTYYYPALCVTCDKPIYGARWVANYAAGDTQSENNMRDKCWKWILHHFNTKHAEQTALLFLLGRGGYNAQ